MISHYDYHIINDNLSVAYEALKSILIAEEDQSQIGENLCYKKTNSPTKP